MIKVSSSKVRFVPQPQCQVCFHYYHYSLKQSALLQLKTVAHPYGHIQYNPDVYDAVWLKWQQSRHLLSFSSLRKRSGRLCNPSNHMRLQFFIIQCNIFFSEKCFSRTMQKKHSLPHQNCKIWPWLSLMVMSDNRSGTTCSMELIICAGIEFFSLGVLERATAVTLLVWTAPFLNLLMVASCMKRHAVGCLTEISNEVEFTWGVNAVGGMCSLLVSKLIISLCQWSVPVENMNQSARVACGQRDL